MSTLGNVLSKIRPAANRKRYRAQGKAAVKLATGSTSNACAATASQPLLALGIIPHVILGAQSLADTLENHGWVREHNRGAVQPGWLIVCEDANHNKRSDHVWFALSNVRRDGKALCFDNQGVQGISQPYWRNLGTGARTPMWYALRPKD